MDFDLSPKDKAFQQEVRDFIQANMTPAIRKGYEGLLDTPERREFISKMVPKGWLAMGFPKEYGGDGTDNLMAKYLLNLELLEAGGPIVGKNLGQVCGALMLYGSEELKREFIGRTLRNEIQWTITYSEPGAGSDLASMSTRGVPDGDDFIINGEKRWITSAHFADYFWLAVRTDPNLPKHKGISLFIVDVNSPGVTIQPISMVFEGHRTNTVFFDNVRVPRARLVGELNMGWTYIMNALNFERFMMISARQLVRRFDKIFNWVKTAKVDGKPLLDDPVVRHKLAKVDVLIEKARMLDLRCIAKAVAHPDKTPAMEAMMNKAMGAIAGTELSDTALDLMGPDGYLWDGEAAPLNGDMVNIYLKAGHARVAAAGVDVAKNMIAKVHLKLPS